MQKTAQSSPVTPTPPHVRPEAVFDFDYVRAPLPEVAPHFALAHAIEGAGDIFWTPRNGGHWIVAGAALAVEMMQDTGLFSSDPAYNVTRRFEPTLLPVQADPPDHAEYRKVLGAFFAPGNMRKLAPKIRAIAAELIEQVQPRGRCEFVAEFGEIFPIAVFLSLVDAPMADRPELLRYAGMFTRSPDLDVRTQGTRGLADYVTRLFRARRDSPGDDVISRFLKADFAGRPLNDAELRGLGTLLLLGGLDTVKSVMSFIILWFARHPETYRKLVDDPALIPAAAEEMLRVSGASLPERGITRDATYAGMDVKAGERVVFLLPLMSFDKSLNTCPYDVDFGRELSQHLNFGAGVHRCAGSHLARIEITILLEEWTRAFPNFGLDPDRPVRMEGGIVWTPKEVPLVWPAAGATA